MATTFHELRSRGENLHPGDFIKAFDAVALHVVNDHSTIRILLDRPSPNGNEHVSVPSDRQLDIVRPITIQSGQQPKAHRDDLTRR